MLKPSTFAFRRTMLLAATMLATPSWAQTTPTPAGPPAPAPSPTEQPADQPADPTAATAEDANEGEVVVVGYRASLESQTRAKRESVGFTDSIFAEDIGKFPDTNIAESVNRIPGVTIAREVTGEGTSVAIRGLGTNFTRVLLNGAPVALASVRFDAQSTNREVDLDLLPTELFTQLTVSKSPVASQVEGGAAGTVNLRSARPFDKSGSYLSYSLQGSKTSTADKWGYRGHVIASATFGNFGVLVGAAKQRTEFRVDGYETIGFTNPNLTAAQSSSATRNSTGGGNWTIPGTVPANAGNGLIPGTVIDEAFLLARNPGATITQIDNGLLPRLPRPRTEVGYRDRTNFIASLEWRPSDSLRFYIDGQYGERDTDFNRSSLNWVVRNGAIIPLNTTYDRTDCAAGCVVTGGTYANAQFFLEFRPYRDKTDFWGVNPGVEFTLNDFIKGDLQANYTKSTFHRESPTVLVISPASSGVTVTYDNTSGGVPTVTSNLDVNNPANFGWAGGGRVNLNGEDRETFTKGVRGSLLFGNSDRFTARVGGAYDDTKRRITPFDNTNPWQALICGNNPSVVLPGPNRQPPCDGANAPGATAPAGYPTYPAYGTAYSAGFAPLVYRGSVIPTAAVPQYLMPGDNGFITVDWNKFKAATNYDDLLAGATETGSGSSGANGGLIREKVASAFVEGNAVIDIGDNRLRLNGGVRYVYTRQFVGGRTSLTDPRNNRPLGVCPGASPTFVYDGSCYPNVNTFTITEKSYSNFLPSASAAFDLGRLAVIRASVSRTLTRPDPNALLPGAQFVQPSADVGTVGNDALDPYISDNIDLGVELYTGGEGVISAAAFRKSITGFTVPGTTTVPFSFLAQYGITFASLTAAQQQALIARGAPAGLAPEQVPIIIQQQVNSDGKLKVNGLEFQLTQPLDFLTRYIGLRGFGFQGNLTLIDQKGEGAGAPAVALGVAPTTYVLTGYYDRGGLSARLTYTYNEGSQGSGTNQNGIPLAAIYGRDYDQLDFSGSLDLSRVFGPRYLPTLTVNVINITKSAQRTYFQFPNATFNEYNPGRTVLVGLRGTF